jgi:predicted amidohydrolase YtcJ
VENAVWLTGVNVFGSSPSDLVSAIGILNGKIEVIVDMAELQPGALRNSQIVDIAGCSIYPGFTDAHFHLLGYCLALQRLHLEAMPLDRILETVNRRAVELNPGDWILGRGWEAHLMDNHQFPSRWDLDTVIPDHPAALTSKDGHSIWLNSLAISLLSLDNASLEIFGDCAVRHPEKDSLTGIFFEKAADYVKDRIPQPDESSMRRIIQSGVKTLSSLGLTAIHSFDDRFDTSDIVRNLQSNGECPIRVRYYALGENLDECIARGLKTGQGDQMLHFGGIKLFADGALGSRTAAISFNYPGEPSNTGQIVTSRKDLISISAAAANNDISTAIHAIGDVAVEHALDAMIEARKLNPDLKGLRVEHIQLIPTNRIQEFARYGITASVQPTHAMSDIDMVETLWADARGSLYPYHKLQASGANTVYGSDAPIEPPGPLDIIQAAVTRRRSDGSPGPDGWLPSERVNIMEAITASTQNPAIVEDRGTFRGSLAVGAAADLVVFERDLTKQDPMQLRTNPVLLTTLSGKPVYDPHSLMD